MSHSTRSGPVPVALLENHDFHLTGWNYPCRIVLSRCWTSPYEATLPAKPAAKAGLIFTLQRGNSNSPRTTVTGKSFEVLFNIRQKSWPVGVYQSRTGAYCEAPVDSPLAAAMARRPNQTDVRDSIPIK